ERLIPEADDVLIGHAHYDHILDAPDLCRQTGARLIGSSTAVQVGIAAGLLAQTFGMKVAFTAGPALIAFASAVGTGLLFGYLPA
ncbi:MBL fold metallo-hydrolase, partial [Acinetobacter baumannii]